MFENLLIFHKNVNLLILTLIQNHLNLPIAERVAYIRVAGSLIVKDKTRRRSSNLKQRGGNSALNLEGTFLLASMKGKDIRDYDYRHQGSTLSITLADITKPINHTKIKKILLFIHFI